MIALQRINEELKGFNASLLVVSFNDVETINKWKSETNCIFPIISDQERLMYQKLHLGASVKHTWDIKSQIWYATQLCNDRKLYPMLEGDDPHQLGGDLIVDGSSAKILMIHRSTSPTDRPSIESILDVIKEYETRLG